MTVNKTNKLQVKTSCGLKTLEILKINKAGINARDVKRSAFPVTLTGYEFFGIQFFWEGVKSESLARQPITGLRWHDATAFRRNDSTRTTPRSTGIPSGQSRKKRN